MFGFDFIEEVWYTLSKNKLRSFLTSIGVFFSILFLIMMIGLGMGAKSGLVSMMDEYSNSAYISLEPTSIPHKGYPKGRVITTTAEEVENLSNVVSGIRQANRSSGFDGKVRNVSYNKITIHYAHIIRHTPNSVDFSTMELSEGRMISELDTKRRKLVCLIGENISKALFGEHGKCIGEFIRIDGVYFEVIGVMSSNNQVTFGSHHRTIIVPSTVASELFKMNDEVSSFVVTADDNHDVGVVADNVSALLKRRYGIDKADNNAVYIHNISYYFVTFYNLINGIEILILLVGIGTLLAGVIGVSSIMLITLKERTSEIGVRRALGAKPRDIIMQVMIESFFLTFTTGVFALGAGIFALAIMKEPINVATDGMVIIGLDVKLAVISAAIVLLSSILAGCIPAYRAVKIRAVDAIREE